MHRWWRGHQDGHSHRARTRSIYGSHATFQHRGNVVVHLQRRKCAGHPVADLVQVHSVPDKHKTSSQLYTGIVVDRKGFQYDRKGFQRSAVVNKTCSDWWKRSDAFHGIQEHSLLYQLVRPLGAST